MANLKALEQSLLGSFTVRSFNTLTGEVDGRYELPLISSGVEVKLHAV